MQKKDKVNIGIIGFGVVGTGVVKILNELKNDIAQKVGAEIIIKKIVDKDITSKRRVQYKKNILSTDVKDIIDDPDIDIVVELIGGYNPAKKFIIDSIKNKKHVVTANKAVIAAYWDEIFRQARNNNVLVYFETSVGGGIPIVQGLNEGLAANRINSIYGILNGTTNFILTKMTKENLGFKEALILAQKLGFAESDPTFDIKGIDVLHKIVILASIANSQSFNIKDIYCEGIDNISLKDIKIAEEEFGFVLKLLGITKRVNDCEIELRIHPTFIHKSHLLASVDNEFNAVYVDGNFVGQTVFYGKGAGEGPAASSVVSDIIFLAKQVRNNTAGKSPYIMHSKSKKVRVLKMDNIKSRYYIHFMTTDDVGVLGRITGILGKNNISIEACIQKDTKLSKKVPIIILTHLACEHDIKKALKEIDKFKQVKAKSRYIRIL